MKQFLKKNIIVAAAVMILALMMLNAGFTFYNKNEVVNNNTLKTQTDEVSKATEKILTHILHGLDLGIRAYALTKKEAILMPLDMAISDSKPLFKSLDSLLTSQNYDISALSHFKKTIDTYIEFNLQMVDAVRNDRMDDFRKMQAEDRGYAVWIEYTELSNNITKFEEQLNQQANTRYEAALNNNSYLQILLLLISIPTLGFIVFKIRNDETSRKNLLFNLEENNRKYIFNPGTETKVTSTEEVIAGSIHNFKEAVEFIKHISNGNFEADWKELNEKNRKANEDNLVGELVKMRERMKTVKIEDEKRMWATEGLAKFSEIVRNNQNNLETLSLETVRFLTRYLKAQQGSLFITNEGERGETYLQLEACYAFDKKKYVEKRIDIGSGLVGQAYLEKEAIILKEIPQGYTAITSGLGEATPTCLLIIPLKYNENVNGVMELAGFKVFEDYQIAFLEKAGEFVASAIMTVKIADKTNRLLKQSQEQADMLKNQEETLRQNMEELQATQEEVYRKAKKEIGITEKNLN